MKEKILKVLNTVCLVLKMSTDVVIFNFEPVLLLIFLDEDAILKISIYLLVVKLVNIFASIGLDIIAIVDTFPNDGFDRKKDDVENKNDKKTINGKREGLEEEKVGNDKNR